jgi:signal transduction histidine kinase
MKDYLKKSGENDQASTVTSLEGVRKTQPLFVIQPIEEEVDATGELKPMNNPSQDIKNLELAARYKDEFLARLSHELRNPVSSINAAAEILSLAQPDPARLQKMTEVIKRQINLLVGLIDDLSDVSHFTQGLAGSDMRLLDITHLVTEAVEESSTLIKARNHTLTVESSQDDLYIIGDHKRILQVLKNLLGNAAKYTPQGGNIEVKLNVESGHIVVNVIDDGNGIAPDLLPKIFDLFGPASQTTDHLNHGLGIGLAVVKNIVVQHNGSVKAFSNEGIKGSRFEIRFPATASIKTNN